MVLTFIPGGVTWPHSQSLSSQDWGRIHQTSQLTRLELRHVFVSRTAALEEYLSQAELTSACLVRFR